MAVAEVHHDQTGHAAPAGIRMRARWTRHIHVAIPASLVGLIVFLCFVWPLIGNVPPPVGGSVFDSDLPPLSSGHFLGTDQDGYDTWSRLLYGGRSSLGTAFAVTVIGLVVGGSLGAQSGYWGGKVDEVMMRILDMFLAFPSLVLTLVIARGLGPSQLSTIWAISVTVVPLVARIARGATLRLREQPFMVAARLSGTRNWRVLVRHIAPNILPQLTTFSLLGMGIIIVIEGSLNFLGLGVPPPDPTWGSLIYEGQQNILTNPTLALFPCVMVVLTVLAFTLLGEALRNRWNVR
jgi:peptide/nickel transport system permease protein